MADNVRMKRDGRISIRLPMQTIDALQALADREKRTLADYVRLTLDAHIARETAKASDEPR
jgi:predicted DNA-binding protein